jgi:hypothetical protein
MAPVRPIVRVNYESGERHERHAHDYANVSVVLAGSLRERVGRTEVIARPLSVVVKPAGTEHEDTFGPTGAVMLRMRLPDAWARACDATVTGAGRWRWLTSAPAARWLVRLAAANARKPWAIEDGMAECLGATTGDAEIAPDPPIPDWLERVRERIRDERGNGTRVATLAHDVGVHPVYPTRRFRFTTSVAFPASPQRCRSCRRTALVWYWVRTADSAVRFRIS